MITVFIICFIIFYNCIEFNSIWFIIYDYFTFFSFIYYI